MFFLISLGENIVKYIWIKKERKIKLYRHHLKSNNYNQRQVPKRSPLSIMPAALPK